MITHSYNVFLVLRTFKICSEQLLDVWYSIINYSPRDLLLFYKRKIEPFDHIHSIVSTLLPLRQPPVCSESWAQLSLFSGSPRK